MNNNKFLVNLVTGFVKITGYIPAMLFFKPKVHFENKENQGRKLPSPCLLVSNHNSLLDFVLYLIVFPFRTIRFLMAEVLFNKGKLFGGFLYALGGIKVDRDARSFDFVNKSLLALEKKNTVGIFPEGRLPIGGRHFPFTVSTVYIALKTEAPIIPVYTDGNYGIKKRANVVIGEKFYVRDYLKEDISTEEQLEELTKILENKVYSLKEFISRKN